MSSISNFMMKKSIPLGIKSKKKSIPININSNPGPGRFVVTNPINQVASSYFSMGQKIQISKNLKNSKLIHVNTNSAINYYTNPGNDSKHTNSSIGNSYLTNYPMINSKNSELSGINFNNYFNNVSQQNYSGTNNSLSKNIIKYNNINFKGRKQLSTITNSILPNDININGYQTSKNNNNNAILNNKYINNNNHIIRQSKNKIISTNSKSNLSKVKQTYSTRPNFLDSRNKSKKIPMKSKIRQYKYPYKNGKPVSTSFSNIYMNKNNNLQNSEQRENMFNYVRVDLLNNINKEGNHDNIYTKINTIANNVANNNLFEIKGRHFRHNTASFDNRDIINIFNKNNLLDKSSKNINHLNINNNIGLKGNNIICINNVNSTKNANSIANKNNLNNDIISHNNMGYKISNFNNIKKKNNQYSKGKNGDSKIIVKDRRNNVKENNKYNSNTNNNGINSNANYIYHNYHTNNVSAYNHVIHHIKNSNSINMNINGIKKISIKQKEPKKNHFIKNQSKLISKPIPTPSQKVKGNLIPSQRNIKINLSKFIEDVKIKQNSKVIIGRKSLSIKKLSKENNSDFSVSQLNEKFGQKISKNNEEGNDINNFISNISNNKKIINKTIQEENKFKGIKNYNELENNILIDTNYISNIQNKDKDYNKKNQSNINKEVNKHKNIIGHNNINNHKKINYDINSTSNNNFYGKRKNDYSVDNPADISNSINHNQINIKDKENLNEMNINNITDIVNQNANEKNHTYENIIHKKIDFDHNNSLSSDKTSNKNKQNDINEDIYTLKTKDSSKKKSSKKTTDNRIYNTLFDDENLADLPEDYDENFNDLYSIINKMNFSNVLVCVEGFFTPEGRSYNKYKDKFDKFYDNLFNKKGNSFVNSNMKPKKIMEGFSMTSNTKTNSSSSKKNVINNKYNDLNIVKDLNVY